MSTPSGEFNGFPWYLAAERDPGHRCGECGRFLKIYQRRLSRAMARGLIRLYKLDEAMPQKIFFHVKQFDKEGARGEFGVLSAWNLVKGMENLDKDKRTSGMWSITDFGRKFVGLQEMVPQYVLLKWESEILGFSGKLVNAKECLEHGNKFSYRELMEWVPRQGVLF